MRRRTRTFFRRFARTGYWFTLLVCAAVAVGSVVIWVRSQFVSDDLYCSLDRHEPGPTTDTVRWKLRSVDLWTTRARSGSVRIRLLNLQAVINAKSYRDRHDGIDFTHISLPASTAIDEEQLGSGFDVAGFGVRVEKHSPKNSTDRRLYLELPDWSITVSSGVLMIILLRRWRRQRMPQRQGLCKRCGYDLRASTVKCPECGLPISPSVTAGKSGATELPA